MKFPILACACLTINITLGQKAPIKFGDIPLEQLKMTRYEKDSSAEAIILADYGESTIEYVQSKGFVLNFERIRRIKILTKDGLRWGDLSIALYHNSSGDSEKISGLKAVTYNLENGKPVESKVKGESIFKEKRDDNWDVTKVTWPNVKEGSILEISYSMSSDFLFNFQSWQFQNIIPVLWSEYRARIPEYFNYSKYMQGYISLTINEQTAESKSINLNYTQQSGGTGFTPIQTSIQSQKIDYLENRFRWAAQNVPAFISEPFMTTYLDFISKINFELASIQYPNQPLKNYMGTWADINKTYAEDSNFLPQIKGNGFLKKIVEEVVAGTTNAEEKIKAIDNYIKQNIEWDEISRKYATKSLKKVLEDKKGNSAEINFLFASMLEKADINIFPVLLSTRDHGFVRELIPVSSQFNYVICLAKLDNKSILLDATEKLLPVGALPERCLNGNGFAISEAGYEWVKLQSTSPTRTVVNVTGTLAGSGELTGNLQIERIGYEALATRKEYLSKGEADYFKNFKDSRQWEFTKSEIKNAKTIHEPLKEIHDIVINDQTTVTGDILYLNPFVMLIEESNPFKSDKREYPVDFGSPIQEVYMAKIIIPNGFIVEELPKSRVLMLPGSAAKYSYNASVVNNTITLISNFQINKSLFVPEEYANLREFYSQMVAKQAEQIVLKKN